MATTFLHGCLVIKVEEARNIPNMESWMASIIDKNDVTDPFVDVKLGEARIAKTSIIMNDLNPVWNETFRIEVCHKAELLVFDVRDKDHATTEEVGTVEIPTQVLTFEKAIEGWFPITKKSAINGELKISVQFTSTLLFSQSYEVESYFKAHTGCRVRLYQDTCCSKDIPWLNMVRGPEGRRPSFRSCWKDLYFDLEAAQHLITITGWSVHTQLKLFRGQDAIDIYGGTLGELLCKKADEGVEVKVMVWGEYTTGQFMGDQGYLNTMAYATYKYFEDSRNYTRSNGKVVCARAPRSLKDGTRVELSEMLHNKMVSGTYTHHQKTIVCDAPDYTSMDGRRKLIAYVGGLDLTGGRYDNPRHSIFSTLKTDHLNDFRNSNIKSTTVEVGPREPWHDIHSRVEGPIARDVLENFIERWKLQGEGDPPKLDENEINPLSHAQSSMDDPKEEWHVQQLRSITSDSAELDLDGKDKLVLTKKKGRLVEKSITQAHIKMIRQAKNFIYIESQYFMGSAFCWLKDFNTPCNHIVPVEITAKIRAKMLAGERFTAYIVIPMWPEGDPTAQPVQAQLYWQARTMEMMYKEVGDALREARVPSHLGDHPTDWLIFLCPGIRELPGPHMDVLDPPQPGSLAKQFRKTMRQMIYVHSKMLIVDDAYIIVGSANLNERSMSGTRDTEIAVGCWQPHYSSYNPYGDVHMFRMSLWAEHLKTWEEVFRHPGTLACTQRVKEMCTYNWKSFNFDYYNLPKNTLPPGHLLTYPVEVRQNNYG